MKAPAETCSIQLVGARCSVFGRAHWGSTVGYLLLKRFSKGLAIEFSSCFNSVLLDLDYMIAVLMHRRIRNPSRGPNTLYMFKPQQNLGLVFFCFFFNVKPV